MSLHAFSLQSTIHTLGLLVYFLVQNVKKINASQLCCHFIANQSGQMSGEGKAGPPGSGPRGGFPMGRGRAKFPGPPGPGGDRFPGPVGPGGPPPHFPG